MLCYNMLCCVVSSRAVPCSVVLCCAVFRFFVSGVVYPIVYGLSCRVVLCSAVPSVVLFQQISCVVDCVVVLCYVVFCCFMLCCVRCCRSVALCYQLVVSLVVFVHVLLYCIVLCCVVTLYRFVVVVVALYIVYIILCCVVPY